MKQEQDKLTSLVLKENSFEDLYDDVLQNNPNFRIARAKLQQTLKSMELEAKCYHLNIKTDGFDIIILDYHLLRSKQQPNLPTVVSCAFRDNELLHCPDEKDIKANLRGLYYGWLTLRGQSFQDYSSETAAALNQQFQLGLALHAPSPLALKLSTAQFTGCLLCIPDQTKAHSQSIDSITKSTAAPTVCNFIQNSPLGQRLEQFHFVEFDLLYFGDLAFDIMANSKSHKKATALGNNYNLFFCFETDQGKDLAVALCDIFFHPGYYLLPKHLRSTLKNFLDQRLQVTHGDSERSPWDNIRNKQYFGNAIYLDFLDLTHFTFAQYLCNLPNVNYQHESSAMLIADGIGYILKHYRGELMITFDGNEFLHNIQKINLKKKNNQAMLDRKLQLKYNHQTGCYLLLHIHTVNSDIIPLTETLCYHKATQEVVFATTTHENVEANLLFKNMKEQLHADYKQSAYAPIRVFAAEGDHATKDCQQVINVVQTADFESQDQLSFCINRLLEYLCKDDDVAIDLSSLSSREISEKDIEFHMQFHSSQSQQSQFQLLISKNGEIIKNDRDDFLNSFLNSFAQGLQKGLGGHSYGELKRCVVLSNHNKRQNELLLLRHAGFFRYLVQNCIDSIRSNQQDNKSAPQTKRELQSFASQMIKDACSLLELAPQKLTTDKELKNLFSANFLKNIRDYMITFYLDLQSTQHSYTADGSIEIQPRGIVLLPIAEFILKLYQYFQPINSFKKSRLSDVMIEPLSTLDFIHQDDYLETEQGLTITLKKMTPATFLQDTLSLFHNLGLGEDSLRFHFSYNDQPISRLTESDLQGNFILNEKSDGIDWFSLDPQLFFQGKKVEPQSFLKGLQGKVLEHEGEFYLLDKKTLPSLKWLDFFWEQIHQQALNKQKKTGITQHQHYVQLERCKTLELLALEKAGMPVIAGKFWKKIKEKFHQLSLRTNQQQDKGKDKNENDTAMLHSNLPLHNYQKMGVQWLIDLYDLNLGGILADDMGLGKTIQSIAFLQYLYDQNELNQSLIVVPTSLVYNWKAEIEKFAPSLALSFFDGQAPIENQKQPMIMLATYGQLLHNQDFFENQQWQIAIFDEAQNLKNIVSQKSAAARRMNARMKIALTGTPMENHYGEFYSLIDLVVPGALGDFDTFKRNFKLNKSVAQNDQACDPRHLEFLKLKTKPLLLRRKKSEILHELPDKTESDIVLNFDKEQATIYRDVAISSNHEIQKIISEKGEAKSQLQMLSVLLKLRQICTSPQLVAISEIKKNKKGTRLSYNHISPKIERCLEMLEELIGNNESVLLFTTFLTTIDLVVEQLKKIKIPYAIIHGQVPLKERAKILEHFNQSKSPMVLLMTLKTGGVGLNLTKARYVLHLEPWWNPAVENQATDRVHRMGQKRSVYVYKFLMNKSVEEKIQTLKDRKGQLFEALLGSENSVMQSENSTLQKTNARLTKEDFLYLLE